MKSLKTKILAAVCLIVFTSTAAFAYVTPGDLNRLRGLAMTLVSATITTLTATTETITTSAITTLNLSGVMTSTRAPSADSATTNKAVAVNLTSPVDTTGTNTHNGVDVGLTISNATGGTNTVNALNVGNVTGDAEVNINGLKIGTGSRLGTTNAITISTGWDKGLDITNSAAADSAATEMGIDLNVTTPVDTTGTNTHYGLNLDFSIGNASGGTNTAGGINIANVTGDAQVDVTGLNIGTGTTLGTSNAIKIGSGWDAGISDASGITTSGTLTTTGPISIDAVTINRGPLTAQARGTITICGDATTVNNNTVYYGPTQVLTSSATIGAVVCDTTAAGNVTEATADAPALPATAFYPLGMICWQPDSGNTITYTLRSAAAAITPAISVSIADNVLSGAATATATTAVASGATLAVAVASSGDIGTVPFRCDIAIAY